MSNEKITGRNSFDVAMELVNIHLEEVPKEKLDLTKEELEEIYLFYYQLVQKNR